MAKKSGTSIEAEHHVNGVRMRVTGAGNLNLRFVDLGDTRNYQMVDLPLNLNTRVEPTRLGNFQSQRIRLEIKVTEINEHFHIRRIIIFAKAVAVEYPG